MTGTHPPTKDLAASAPSYASGPSEVALLGDTIGQNLARTAAAFPDRDALVDMPSGRRWTYSEIDADVTVLAAALLARGISRGDRIGIWSPSCAEWFIVQYATARIGVILVPINPAYRRSELEYVVNHAEIRMVFSAQRFKTSNYRSMLDETLPNTPTLDSVVYIDSGSWDALMEQGRHAHAEDPDAVDCAQSALSMEDPINIQYTSGTTGFPKGATLSHHNVHNNAYSIGAVLG
ncbi:MAG: AMP-binding protein, partial [Pseudonocardiaceae bacterium]